MTMEEGYAERTELLIEFDLMTTTEPVVILGKSLTDSSAIKSRLSTSQGSRAHEAVIPYLCHHPLPHLMSDLRQEPGSRGR